MFGLVLLAAGIQGPTPPDLPIRGLHLAAPSPAEVPTLTKFIREALPRERVNTLVLEIDYGYKFKSRPEMADPMGLSEADVKAIVHACHDAKVRLIPQINLLGHQSWAKHTDALLTKHPEFDETPGKYPENKGIYCRSYCPLAPGLHGLLFDLIDELCDACECDAFHCGMDEVFILADPECPRCKGKPTAELFAGEVNTLHDHLKSKGRQMWMWGDRFLDGRTNGLGEWEASTNGTPDAINHVPKDIVICDWHYERAEPTPALFALNGFQVLACPWRQADTAKQQVAFMRLLRSGPNPKIAEKALGVLHTTWCGASAFIRAYSGDEKAGKEPAESAACFKAVMRAAAPLI
ncbi:MAG TPA: family 20 glycosylhydrolase [Fimbriimonadaceae bacterium]|nr:family 20 glycosylhydrolase [Fimbriimonadaceae bacterium]